MFNLKLNLNDLFLIKLKTTYKSNYFNPRNNNYCTMYENIITKKKEQQEKLFIFFILQIILLTDAIQCDQLIIQELIFV